LDSANARKILGYFIEEAKEHLETLEQGILDLGNLVNNNEQMNEMLESLFLKGYDLLQILIDKLQSPLGLQGEEADAIVKNGEATFAELHAHLNYLLGQVKSTPAIAAASSISISVRDILKQMLQLFKQQETSASRQQLQKLILPLSQLASEQQQWQYLVKNAQSALSPSVKNCNY